MKPALRTLLPGGPLNYGAAVLLNVSTACSGIGVSLLVTTDPAFQAGHVYSRLALLFAVGGVAAGLAAAFLARLSDRVGRRPMILISVAGIVGTSLLFGVAAAWWHLFVVMILHACLLGMYWPSLEARITDGAEGREMARRLGAFGIVISAALLSGPAIGGCLSDLWVRAPFYVAASFAALLLILFAAGSRCEESQDGHHRSPPIDTDPDPIRVEPSIRRAFLISAWAANGANSAASPILRGIFPRFAKLPTADGGLGLSGGEAGAILAAIGVSMLLMFVVLGRYPFWHYRFRYLLLGQAASAAGCLLFALYAPVPILIAGALLYGIGSGVAYLSSIYYSLHGHAARGGQSGRHEAILSLGFSVGMLTTAAMMWFTASQRTPYWICVGILLTGIVVQGFVVTRARRQDAKGVKLQGADGL